MKKKVIAVIILGIVVLSLFAYYFFLNGDNKFQFDFFNNKEKVEFQKFLLQKNDNYSKYEISFKSSDVNVHSLLIIPQQNKKVPAIVVLPAASATKESREWYGDLFGNMGYATIILDQRGIGETGGFVPSIMEDYQTYDSGKKPYQQLFVDDAIAAIDVLSQIQEIDINKIAILGESMGGRYAIISAAKDKRIKIALIVSSSGYRGNYGDEKFNDFIASINPNNYIGKITPRKVVMFHSDNDTVISIDEARYTYSLANEPKELIVVNNCFHGYCDQMLEKMRSNLQSAFAN